MANPILTELQAEARAVLEKILANHGDRTTALTTVARQALGALPGEGPDALEDDPTQLEDDLRIWDIAESVEVEIAYQPWSRITQSRLSQRRTERRQRLALIREARAHLEPAERLLGETAVAFRLREAQREAQILRACHVVRTELGLVPHRVG